MQWLWEFRILLRAGGIRKVADHFEVDHAADAVVFLAAGAGVAQRSHIRPLIEWRLFIDESNIADRAMEFSRGELPGDFQKSGYGGGIVIRAGRWRDRIVMRAQDQDFIR